MSGLEIGIAFGAAALIAGSAWRVRMLTVSGAVAAAVLGGTVTAAGGWSWGIVLIVFFVTSSILSLITHRLRPQQGRNVQRGSNRDAWQVFANGGVAMLCAVAWVFGDRDWIAAAFIASLATAAADTWATEIGAFSRFRPRLITTFRPVERGVSGGVSILGTLATVAGASCIALAGATLIDLSTITPWTLFTGVAAAGVIGSLADSLLGATVQIHYRCPDCDEITERTVHRCGTPTVTERGIRFMTNDTVNVTAIVIGAIAGALLTM